MKILTVCTGNTCRSPMLACLLRYEAARLGLGITVESAGCRPNPVGAPASLGAFEAMRARGLSLEGHRSGAVAELDLGQWDLIFCLTPAHAAFVRQLGCDDGRIRVLRESEGGVRDPYGESLSVYEEVARLLGDEATQIALALVCAPVVVKTAAA